MLTSQTALDNIVPGILLALAGTFMFSLKPILVKYAYEIGLSSEQVIALRMLFSTPFYLCVALFVWYKNSNKRDAYIKHLVPAAGLGILGYFIASYLDLLGLQYISAQLERVVLFCFPTIVVLMSSFFFKTKLPKNIWLLLGVSYSGILLIFAHDLGALGPDVALGTSLVFLSAIAFAIYVLWSKPIIASIGSQMFTSLAMLSASVCILVLFVATEDIASLDVSYKALGLTLSIAFFCTVIPSLLIAEAIHQIGPERTSIVGTCGPVITAIVAVMCLGESFTVYHAVGLSMIILAMGLMIKEPKKAGKKSL